MFANYFSRLRDIILERVAAVAVLWSGVPIAAGSLPMLFNLWSTSRVDRVENPSEHVPYLKMHLLRAFTRRNVLVIS